MYKLQGSNKVPLPHRVQSRVSINDIKASPAWKGWVGLEAKLQCKLQRTQKKQKRPVRDVWDLSINGKYLDLDSLPLHDETSDYIELFSDMMLFVHQSEVWSVKVKYWFHNFPLIFPLPLLSGCTAEPPRLLIPGLQRTLGECFDKGVESFIPPCYSEVNYNQITINFMRQAEGLCWSRGKTEACTFIWVN